MAEVRRILGQSLPTATTEAVLYNCTSTATISTLIACNTGAAAIFNVAVRRKGAAADAKQYIYFETPLAVGESFALTGGLTFSEGESIWVESDTGLVAFNVFGAEGA